MASTVRLILGRMANVPVRLSRYSDDRQFDNFQPFGGSTRIASYDAAILPLPAGTLTQLEMSQKRLKVLGKTLGHNPSLGVFCWLEVTDFDRFFGFLFLVLHVTRVLGSSCRGL